MKTSLIKFLIIILSLSSCSFLNKKEVEISIVSNPTNANIVINNRHYGRTPAILYLEPQEYSISLQKEGYGSSNLVTSIWAGAIRTDAKGSITKDGVRCLLDMVSVIFFFNAFTEKCSDFKQKSYNVNLMPSENRNISYNEAENYRKSNNSEQPNGNSYYNQEMMKNLKGADYYNPYNN